jgi:tellurite resistance protein TehA-like permease
VIAIASVIRLAKKERIGFNMGWWAFTFPLGVFSTATTQLATELDSEAFRILGMIFSLSVVALWLYIASMTSIKACSGVM